MAYLDSTGLNTLWAKIKTLVSVKADKVSGATANNLAAFDSNGNLKDSGYSTQSVSSISIDSTPTASSTNLVTSGGVRSAIDLSSVHVIEGNSSDTAGTWTGTDSTITSYFNGLTVIYIPKVAGASTTTLNINGLGAITCYYSGTTKLATHYAANTPILFTYYNSAWKRADYSTNTWSMPVIKTSASTAAKVGTCAYYTLTANQYLAVNLIYANTKAGALTLNIASKGAKPIYINGAASSSSNYTLPAGIYIVYYNGTNYYFRTDGTIEGIQSTISDIATIRSNASAVSGKEDKGKVTISGTQSSVTTHILTVTQGSTTTTYTLLGI